MDTEIKGNKLIITIDLIIPRPSQSGKTLIVATTGGFTPTTAQLGGKTVSLSINATIPAK